MRSEENGAKLTGENIVRMERIVITLCKILDGHLPGIGDGVQVDRENLKIWATTSCVAAAHNQDSKEHLSEREVGGILKTICSDEVVTEKHYKKARWKLLKWPLVLEVATRHGGTTKVLSEFKKIAELRGTPLEVEASFDQATKNVLYIWFQDSESPSDRFWGVGVTSDFDGRKPAYNVHNPKEAVLYLVFRSQKAFEIEKRIKEILAAFRSKTTTTEWFFANDYTNHFFWAVKLIATGEADALSSTSSTEMERQDIFECLARYLIDCDLAEKSDVHCLDLSWRDNSYCKVYCDEFVPAFHKWYRLAYGKTRQIGSKKILDALSSISSGTDSVSSWANVSLSKLCESLRGFGRESVSISLGVYLESNPIVIAWERMLEEKVRFISPDMNKIRYFLDLVLLEIRIKEPEFEMPITEVPLAVVEHNGLNVFWLTREALNKHHKAVSTLWASPGIWGEARQVYHFTATSNKGLTSLEFGPRGATALLDSNDFLDGYQDLSINVMDVPLSKSVTQDIQERVKKGKTKLSPDEERVLSPDEERVLLLLRRGHQ